VRESCTAAGIKVGDANEVGLKGIAALASLMTFGSNTERPHDKQGKTQQATHDAAVNIVEFHCALPIDEVAAR